MSVALVSSVRPGDPIREVGLPVGLPLRPLIRPEPTRPEPARPVIRILVVDDDLMVRRLLDKALPQFHYRVRTVEDVAAGLAELRREHYDLVLCDHDMPGGSGMELLDTANRIHPDLPVIMLTARSEVDLARAAISIGAADFVTKPFDLPQLVRVIEQTRERVDRDRRRTAEWMNVVLTGTIRALASAVDAKDPHTASHSTRVAALCAALAEAMGLAEERKQVLEVAALLHDVGKIGVPDGVLTKSGPLNTEEWAYMRAHPARSAEIVGQVPQLAEVAGIVRHHHERMDGMGYPDGVQGEAIHPLSRLLAICDVYEALTASRSYRRALAPEAAREIVARALGSHLDPEMGGVFLSLDTLP